MRVKDLGVLVLLASIWGSSYLFIRVAASPLGPVLVALARVTVAAGGLLVLDCAFPPLEGDHRGSALPRPRDDQCGRAIWVDRVR